MVVLEKIDRSESKLEIWVTVGDPNPIGHPTCSRSAISFDPLNRVTDHNQSYFPHILPFQVSFSSMADASALCVSSASLFPSCRSRSRSNPSSRFFFSPQTKTAQLRFAALKSRANNSDAGGVFGDDPYGPYPWESSSESLGSGLTSLN